MKYSLRLCDLRHEKAAIGPLWQDAKPFGHTWIEALLLPLSDACHLVLKRGIDVQDLSFGIVLEQKVYHRLVLFGRESAGGIDHLPTRFEALVGAEDQLLLQLCKLSHPPHIPPCHLAVDMSFGAAGRVQKDLVEPPGTGFVDEASIFVVGLDILGPVLFEVSTHPKKSLAIRLHGAHLLGSLAKDEALAPRSRRKIEYPVTWLDIQRVGRKDRREILDIDLVLGIGGGGDDALALTHRKHENILGPLHLFGLEPLLLQLLHYLLGLSSVVIDTEAKLLFVFEPLQDFWLYFFDTLFKQLLTHFDSFLLQLYHNEILYYRLGQDIFAK